mmetsp:Transcript_3918/g.4650  ORF Transcript_3918/g.4650 Transcript_3918/m.4650 type:complete len:132 (+) Transcript_3918:1548-1943(+)|eukprot:CAMPEP_0170477662 /NCGR_PEP_ID=MMETSP0123-20130129/18867_1 /TAXON_ID=182087 /ORGANISM="Favella ehrenbergii, Strain Fehren 1" /LENGTH=131 /DNA_ID=CAMNT_0010749505 /DNA_START=1488 /DNA_END=1883 /DNA_ORIENTATION=+
MAIEKHHTEAKQQDKVADEAKRQAFGVSHNLFDVSSYAEVHFNNMMQSPGQQKGKAENYDQSVSLVQMQDSMAFDDLKGMKKKASEVQPIIEEGSPHDSQMTGNFDNSADSGKLVNQSAHYMLDTSSPTSN